MTRLLHMLDPFDEIKRIYFSTTRDTIERDFARALELLTHMASDEARQKVAGYMHGLADLRREWAPARKKGPAAATPAKTSGPSQGRRKVARREAGGGPGGRVTGKTGRGS
jgi:hypothetical protein